MDTDVIIWPACGRWYSSGSRRFETSRRPAVSEPRIDDELARGLGWGIEESDGGRVIWQWAGTPIACIGLEPRHDRDEADITSLAVLPDWRRHGFARALIFGACEHLGLRAVRPRLMPTQSTSPARSA